VHHAVHALGAPSLRLQPRPWTVLVRRNVGYLIGYATLFRARCDGRVLVLGCGGCKHAGDAALRS
jgi:hypothetical protein